MRHTLTLLPAAVVFAAVVLVAASCNSSGNKKPPPKTGNVLSAAPGNGAVVISLGAQDGLRSGQALPVTRGGKLISEIILHQVSAKQAVGTPYGPASNSVIRAGDVVIVPE